jgi:nifR3 family TIM-barrel protein
MAGITSLPFRLIVKKLGAGLVTTEMISAEGLIRGQKTTLNYLKSHPDERPLSVQIFGSDPEVMARAAGIVVKAGANIVDINMGCPVKKIIKTGAGGALLRSPQRVKEIVTAVRRSCQVPLTVKIRAGWSTDKSVAVETARLIEDCGANAVTIHPRFVKQGFSGKADWNIIADVKEQLKIPVIGNGDVLDPSLALQMKGQTGCDGVMIGRGAIGKPWIFKQILDMEDGRAIRQPGLHERRTLIMEHFRLLSVSIGEYRAAKTMRGLLLWYTKGLPHSSRFRGLITRIKDWNTLISALDQYFSTLEDEKI